MATRINQLKKTLKPGDKKVLEDYESSINDFFDELKNKGFLKAGYSPDQAERLKKLKFTSNSAATLVDSYHKLYFYSKPDEIKQKEHVLEKLGFKTSLDHYLTVICHGYQVMCELLKINMVALIDFDAMGINRAGNKPLGRLVHRLKNEFYQNKFIDYVNIDIRNSVTHYTYYFDNHKLYLCNGVFDPSPKEMELGKFMIESRTLNILTESFLLIYLDKYRPGGELKLNHDL